MWVEIIGATANNIVTWIYRVVQVSILSKISCIFDQFGIVKNQSNQPNLNKTYVVYVVPLHNQNLVIFSVEHDSKGPILNPSGTSGLTKTAANVAGGLNPRGDF